MIIKDIIDYLETYFPLSLAYDWDHCGLQVGNINKDVKKIMIALTLDLNVINECVKQDIDLLITHHPLIFDPLYQINTEDEAGKIIELALIHHITIFSYHTCMDRGLFGQSINDWLMEALNIKDYKDFNEEGLIKVAPYKTTLNDLIQHVKKQLSINTIRYVGNKETMINTIGIVGGSGADFIDELANHVDTLITGDIKYHEAQNALSKGLSLIDVGHFAESIMISKVKELLEKQFDIEIFESKQKDYFSYD